jgi:hypothetical protein
MTAQQFIDSYLGQRPGLPADFNAGAAMQQGMAGGQQLTGAQADALNPVFRQLFNQQFGSIQQMAGGLNNSYTQGALNQLNQSFADANQLGALGAQIVPMANAAGQQISDLAPTAQQQASFAANNINRLAPQVTQIGDAAAANVNALAPQVISQGDAAAANINRLAPQVTRIGDQYMGQIGGLGSMLADQSRNAFAQAGPTGIEQALYDQGQAELALGRSLSAEELRDATQSARQGMAARGMATGNAGTAAELLNRDRFANQRLNERRAFAASANNMRERNVMDRRKAAGDLADISGGLYDTAGRLGMSGREISGRMYDAAGRVGMAGREIAGNLYDTGGRLGMTGREISGRLYDAGGRMDLLGTQTAGDLRQAGADTMMQGSQIGGALLNNSGLLRQRGALAMTEIDPFSRAIQGGLSLGQSAQGLGMDSIGRNYGEALGFYGDANTFNINRGDSLYNSWLNNATAAQTGQMAANAQTQAANTQAAATRAARPTWWETTLGAVGRIFSDERMKTDVKPLGKAGNVLGLTAYEFRYKGDKKKRKGFMAQDVQKVLPEAVEEVEHQGKKRLTIKPMVIGAALAEELMAAKAA